MKKNMWTIEDLKRERQDVLMQWDKSNHISLDESVKYLASLSENKNAAMKVLDAQAKGKVYLCPSLGADTIDAHKELLQYVESNGEVDMLTTYLDSFTRNNRYAEVVKAFEQDTKNTKISLNGFPVVNHSVEGCRKVTESVKNPILIFGPSPDVRLAVDVGISGGHTGYSGGPLISFWNYTKNIPVKTVIHNFQYVNRLMGFYEERGIPILYCVSGAMPANSPPSLFVAPEILEALLAAEQGVKHIQLNCWFQGNIVQDAAVTIVLKKLTDEYLRAFGYNDVCTSTFSVCPTGRFPSDVPSVYGLISYFAMISIACNIQLIGSRTIDEAYHIPSKEGTVATFRCIKIIRDLMMQQHFSILDNDKIKKECYFLEKETMAIINKTIELGDEDIVHGIDLAVEQGILDQTYATTQLVKSRVLGVKDNHGACRYFDFGFLPFDYETKRFHESMVSLRSGKIGKPLDYETIINDLIALSKGRLI